MNTFKALIKREYWENQGSMFYSPVIMALFFAGITILLAITGDSLVINNGHHAGFWEHLPRALDQFENLNEQDRSKGVQVGLYASSAVFVLVMLIISFFYCLSSLYDERKDRSILFWKSLPISDTTTVLSKVVSVCILVPICYFVVIGAFQLFLLVFSTIVAWFGGNSGMTIWGSSNLFGVLFNTLFSLITVSLWLAPVWGWLMLASSYAKKVAFLWGVLPVLMLTIAEGWVFRSSYFIEMVAERFAKAGLILGSNIGQLVSEHDMDGYSIMWYEAYGTSAFWIGLIVAAGFIAASIYVRRSRDEA